MRRDSAPYTWAVGQEVALTLGSLRTYARTVDRVTPSGRAVVGSDQFMPSGLQHGGRWRIRPMDSDARAQIIKQERVKDLQAAVESVNVHVRARMLADYPGVCDQVTELLQQAVQLAEGTRS